MAQVYRTISADSHLEVPADRWVHRVPMEYRDLAPKRVQLPGGGEAQFLKGEPLRVEIKRNLRDRGEGQRVEGSGGTFKSNDGAGPPEQRLMEQDLDGVDAEVIFVGVGSGGSNFLRSGVKDSQAYAAMIRGHNEWLAEEYCAVAPDRLIGLGLIPEADAPTAVAEMEHCARLGLKGVQLTSFPAGKMLPTPEDNLFWAAAVEMDIPLAVHVCFHHESVHAESGLGSTHDGLVFQYPKTPEGPLPPTTPRDPVRSMVTSFGNKPSLNVMQLIFSGVFDQFPTLRLYFAETQIGWLPMWLQEVADSYARHKWAHELYGLPKLQRLPSEYIKEHFMWGFINDPCGVR